MREQNFFLKISYKKEGKIQADSITRGKSRRKSKEGNKKKRVTLLAKIKVEDIWCLCTIKNCVCVFLVFFYRFNQVRLASIAKQSIWWIYMGLGAWLVPSGTSQGAAVASATTQFHWQDPSLSTESSRCEKPSACFSVLGVAGPSPGRTGRTCEANFLFAILHGLLWETLPRSLQ